MHGGLQNRRFRIVTGRTCSCRGGSKVQHRFRKPASHTGMHVQIVPTALISPVGDVLASLKLISFETSFQNVTKSEKPLGYEPSIERSSRFGDAYGLVLELDTESRLQICPKGCRFKSDRGLCRLVQLVERLSLKQEVIGSSPVTAAIFP